MWIDFMKIALQGIPESTLLPPPRVLTARREAKTELLTPASNPTDAFEVFPDASVSKEQQAARPLGEPRAKSEKITEQLF
jgi:penicillin-binding protein 1A